MKRWRVLGQLHSAPAAAKREGSVVTTLLLLLVVGTAQARAFGPLPPQPPFHTEIEISEVAPQRVTHRRPEAGSSVLHVASVEPRPGPRVRSVRTRELPPSRAPDVA